MITVLRIEGEGFDLSTGKDLPPGIVLSNGERERVIYLDPLELRKVVELYVNGPKAEVADTSDLMVAREPTPLPVEPPAKPAPQRKPVEQMAPARNNSYSDPDTGTDSV